MQQKSNQQQKVLSYQMLAERRRWGPDDLEQLNPAVMQQSMVTKVPNCAGIVSMTKLQTREHGNGTLIVHSSGLRKCINVIATLTKPEGTKKLTKDINVTDEGDESEIVALEVFTKSDPDPTNQINLIYVCCMTFNEEQSQLTLLEIRLMQDSDLDSEQSDGLIINQTRKVLLPEAAFKMVTEASGELLVAYDHEKVFETQTSDFYLPGKADE